MLVWPCVRAREHNVAREVENFVCHRNFFASRSSPAECEFSFFVFFPSFASLLMFPLGVALLPALQPSTALYVVECSPSTIHIVFHFFRFHFGPDADDAQCEPWTTKCVFNIIYVSFYLVAPTADGSVAGCVSETEWFFIINKMSKPKPQSEQIYYVQLR